MPFTSDDLAAIDRAIASGELTVDFGDRRTTYRSIEELHRARATILAELNAASATPRPRQYITVTGKGL